MAKRPVIKAKYLPARLPVLGTIVAWLLYRELNLDGVGAGVYITVASIILGLGWILSIAQIFIVEGRDPVFTEDKNA